MRELKEEGERLETRRQEDLNALYSNPDATRVPMIDMNEETWVPDKLEQTIESTGIRTQNLFGKPLYTLLNDQ